MSERGTPDQLHTDVKWKCLLCGRDKFSRPHEPHRCISGTVTKNFRKMGRMAGLNRVFRRVDNAE
jgi:hypothetical protein